MTALYPMLFTPTDKTPRSRQIVWLGLSLISAMIFPIMALQEAFSSEYVVQDDARQHVFWMSRFIDPALFPGDLIADYFQSVAPWGYSSFYHLFAWVGIDPLFLHKCLPLGLALISTVYAFGVCLQLLPIPFAGFLTSLLLNLSLWMRDDIVSATPVAFVYPIFLAFLYYLLRRSLLPCLGTILLQGLFYPQCVFVYAGILLIRLSQWEQGRLRLSSDRTDYWFSVAGLGAAFLVMLPYALGDSEFGAVITASEARAIPAFSPGHWSAFFTDDFEDFWLCGKRSGMLPSEWCWITYDFLPDLEDAEANPLRALLLPPIGLALLLPFLLMRPVQFPIVQQIRPNLLLLPQTLLVSIGLFFTAHALLFRLHLPNRYSEHSLRIITVLAAGIALTLVLEALLRFRSLPTSSETKEDGAIVSTKRSPIAISTAAGLGIVLLLCPFFLKVDDTSLPVTSYVIGRQAGLYQFFAQQPKDTIIASIAPSINKIPSFSRRSILIGGEGYLLPYHSRYYQDMSQRTIDLINAQYSPDLSQVQQFIQTYGVDFWLLEDLSFRPRYLQTNPVFEEFPIVAKEIRPQFRQRTPALARVAEQCTVFQEDKFIVVNATCILGRVGTRPTPTIGGANRFIPSFSNADFM